MDLPIQPDKSTEQGLPPVPQPEAPYFSVSLLKLAVLAVTTFGLYELYWMYQNWKLVQARREHKLIPFWRAFFAIIFVYPLFKAMRQTIEAHDPEAKINPFYAGRLAVMWIIITLLSRFPDYPGVWLASMFSFIPLLVAQARINKLNELMAPGTVVNSKFTWANWIWIVLGGLLLILALIGSFLPPETN